MKISFDLDGVITDGSLWFFKICDAIGKGDRVVNADGSTWLLKEARLGYYQSCKLRYNPQLFLSRLDEGFIITARKSEAEEITKAWLRRHGILLPIFFLPGADNIDWADYENGSRVAALKKLKLIKHLEIQVHFDNNINIVELLRNVAPEVRTILVT